MQTETQKGFKIVKLKSETVDELDSIKLKMEKKQPYLKGVLSYNTIIQMLMLKNKIKISKKKYLKMKLI